jgi:hypothetical protein
VRYVVGQSVREGVFHISHSRLFIDKFGELQLSKNPPNSSWLLGDDILAPDQ